MSLCAKIFARHGNHLSVTSEGYETGHEPVHRSSSGTCVKINDTKDVWHCTNPDCNAGGGSITALMSLEGLSYEEAEAQVQAMGGIVKPRPPKIASFILNDKGKPRTIVANVLKVLEHDPRWQAALRYNVFKDEVEVCQAPPIYDAGTPWPVQALTEEHSIEITAWIQETYDLYAPSATVWDGLRTFAVHHPYHPVRAYLTSLVWDGKPRLEKWLSTYCHVEETAYRRAIGALTLIGAVARVMEPGCKMDTVLILEGPQGWNKSTVWRTLASDEWFTDALPDLHTKDAAQALRGKWLIEFADLDNFRRAELETIKRFLSATQDHYRPSYGRRAVTFPRHNIFVGTTNKWTYLLDETGNRRFLPARITKPCDLSALARDRDQLWAEAMHEYYEGTRWYLHDPDLLRQAEAEQDERMEEDPWAEVIRKYLDSRKPAPAIHKSQEVNTVTTGELLALALQIERTHWTTGSSRRIAAILRLEGWEYTRVEVVRDGEPRKQLKAFVHPLDSAVPHKHSSETDETDDKLHCKASVSGASSHKYSSETDETDSIAIIKQRQNNPLARARRQEEGLLIAP
jgi:predicted P-loop ATPase